MASTDLGIIHSLRHTSRGGGPLICSEALWKSKREEGDHIVPLPKSRELSGQRVSAMNKAFFLIGTRTPFGKYIHERFCVKT